MRRPTERVLIDIVIIVILVVFLVLEGPVWPGESMRRSGKTHSVVSAVVSNIAIVVFLLFAGGDLVYRLRRGGGIARRGWQSTRIRVASGTSTTAAHMPLAPRDAVEVRIRCYGAPTGLVQLAVRMYDKRSADPHRTDGNTTIAESTGDLAHEAESEWIALLRPKARVAEAELVVEATTDAPGDIDLDVSWRPTVALGRAKPSEVL